MLLVASPRQMDLAWQPAPSSRTLRPDTPLKGDWNVRPDPVFPITSSPRRGIPFSGTATSRVNRRRHRHTPLQDGARPALTIPPVLLAWIGGHILRSAIPPRGARGIRSARPRPAATPPDLNRLRMARPRLVTGGDGLAHHDGPQQKNGMADEQKQNGQKTDSHPDCSCRWFTESFG